MIRQQIRSHGRYGELHTPREHVHQSPLHHHIHAVVGEELPVNVPAALLGIGGRADTHLSVECVLCCVWTGQGG